MADQALNIGAYAVYMEDTASTNSAVKQLMERYTLPEGALVYAGWQSAGRGQQQNTWESEPGLNLLCSIYLKPNFLNADEQIWLNLVLSLAVCETINVLSNRTAAIKWPNDIYLDHKKVSGILIENVLQGKRIKYSIAGIGLNVNQMAFGVEKAASLQMLCNKPFDLHAVRQELCMQVEKYYAWLRSKQHSRLWDLYHDRLYGKGVLALFKKDNEPFEATIMGIDKRGKLHLMIDEEICSFAFKEIEFVQLLTSPHST